MPRNACRHRLAHAVPPLAGAAAAMPSVTARTTSRMPSRSKRRLRSASSVRSRTRRRDVLAGLHRVAGGFAESSRVVFSHGCARSSSSGGPGKWKRTGPSGSALTNCLQVRIFGGGDLLGSSLAEDHAVADHVDVVGDLERLVHVVGHHDRGQAERLVQAADQLDDLVERDRVEAGEGLVVHHQLRIGGDGARERHAPRHAAREVVRHHRAARRAGRRRAASSAPGAAPAPRAASKFSRIGNATFSYTERSLNRPEVWNIMPISRRSW